MNEWGKKTKKNGKDMAFFVIFFFMEKFMVNSNWFPVKLQ